MERNHQVTITVGMLGIVTTLIGIFPGIIGLETAEGIGVLQVLSILAGFSLMFTAAYIFARQAFFPGLPTTLAQDIGIRLTLTGLLVSAAGGLADVLGFGTHTGPGYTRPLLGPLQTGVFVGGLIIASMGVAVYAAFGPGAPEDDSDDSAGPPDDAPPAGE